MKDVKYTLIFLLALPFCWACSSDTQSPRQLTPEERIQKSKELVAGFESLSLPYFFDTGLLTEKRADELEALSPQERDFMETALGYDIDDPETEAMRQALELRKVGRLDMGGGVEILVLVDKKESLPRGNRLVSVVNGRISSQIFPLSVRIQGPKFMEIKADRSIRFSGSGGTERLYKLYEDGLFEHEDLESEPLDSTSLGD